jgi:hypothetical protein
MPKRSSALEEFERSSQTKATGIVIHIHQDVRLAGQLGTQFSIPFFGRMDAKLSLPTPAPRSEVSSYNALAYGQKLSLDQALLYCAYGRLSSVGSIEFAQNVLHMLFDCFNANL